MTHRLTLLARLTHVVQAKGHLYQSWETIAAFDCFGAAKGYASECRTHLSNKIEYRVLPLKKEQLT